MEGFESELIDVGETSIFACWKGSGPPLLLLHGFPQTHLMWRAVAPLLASNFTVVCTDLRGYGLSGCLPSGPDHASYAKRAMARDMVGLMERLGHRRFFVAGHDRGGRVAYRMALDHPDRVAGLAVLDVVPTAVAWERADARLALGFWPWSLLAQPEPLPEKILAAVPEAVVDDALLQWGSAAEVFPPDINSAYVEALRAPGHAHAICEEYRAAATLDRSHDEADRAAGRRIACPTLALWSADGALGAWYEDQGGPLAIWQDWCSSVEGRAIAGGHFFPEELPDETAEDLSRFFARF
jgi:haloacetate dehalogenase